MSGIGLASAVRGYMDGQRWQQQQGQIADQEARAAKQRALEAEREAVNQESAGMMKQALQDHVLRGGKPEEFRPPEDLMFKLGEQRSLGFVKRGMVDDYYANEAKLAPIRLQTRARAVQEYQADRDPVKFIMSLNRTMFNGKEIEGVDLVEGADAVQGLAARPGGVQVRFKGEKKPVFMDPEAVAKSVQIGLLDPKDYAKKEADAAFERLKSDLHHKSRIGEIQETGYQQRVTDDRKTRNDEGLEKVKFGYQSQIRQQQDDAADKRNERTVSGGLEQARTSAGARIKAAEIGAGKGGEGNKRDNLLDQAHDELIRSYGTPNVNGQRVGDEFTLRGAAYARDLVADGMPMSEAVRKASEAIKAARAKAKPTK